MLGTKPCSASRRVNAKLEQYTALRYTERLTELRIALSVGSKGDA
jgi:hypothetical protein